MTASRRNAFTLVELLVVTGLLAALMGLVLGGLGRPSGAASSVRSASQDFASRLLAVQSRALGKPEGAALIIAPDATNTRMGTVVLDAVTHPWVTGSVSSGMPPSPSAAREWGAPVTLNLDPPDPEMLKTAYKIRLQAKNLEGKEISPAPSPWYAYSYVTGSVSFRRSAGQTPNNTIWPKSASQAEQAVIARFPTAAGSGQPIAKQVAIDLRHSGMGEDPAATHGYGRFEGTGSIAIAYEQVGRVGEVMRRVQEARTTADQPIEPRGVIYFLFAPRDDISAGRNTLANAQSVWVAINPQTGRVTVAANVAQSAEDATALAAARRNARAGVAVK